MSASSEFTWQTYVALWVDITANSDFVAQCGSVAWKEHIIIITQHIKLKLAQTCYSAMAMLWIFISIHK